MRRLALLPALVAFLLNPSACSPESDPQYQYGAEELRAAIEGTWDLTLQTDAGATAALALTFKQRGSASEARGDRSRRGPVLLREAHACGTRTLIASAAACVDSTEMPLDVAFQGGDATLGSAVIWEEASGDTSLNGTFRVDSLVFDMGQLYLSLAGGGVQVSAQIQEDGTVTSSVGFVGLDTVTATLKRRSE